MDSKHIQKKKMRWSAMDTLILLLILVAVAGLVYRVIYAARKEAEVKPAMYRIYFDVMETHEDVLAEVEGFDAVYLYETDVRLGYIGVYEETATGEYVVALTTTPAPDATEADRVTASGVLICTDGVSVSGGGLRIGESGRYLTPGSVLEVRTDRVLMTIRITSVREHA